MIRALVEPSPRRPQGRRGAPAKAPLAALLAVLGAGGACAEDAGGREGGGPAGREKDPEPPVLHIEEAVFNWGKAFRGEQLEHAFTIENRGGAPLVLEGAKPNCGCMILKDEAEAKRTLKAGEKATITLHIDTHVLEPGAIKNKYTEILSNASSGENRLWVEGEVEALFAIDPPPNPKLEVVRAHTAPPKGPMTFTMTPVAERKVKLLSLAPRKGIVAARFEPADGGKRYVVSVLPALKDRSAFQSDDLEAEVEVNGRKIAYRVLVNVVLKDRIEVKPSPSVYFHKRETQEASKAGAKKPAKVLEVASIGGPAHTFRVTGFAVKEGVFSAALEPIMEGQRYRLTVTLEKTPQKGERFLRDTIELSTDDPEVPLVTIRGSAQF